LRIIPPDDDVVAGIQKIDTIITGPAIKGVEFWLDGRKIAAAARRRIHSISTSASCRACGIRAVAINDKNEPITGDDIAVNIGSDPFRVRITSPRVAPRLVGATRVEMDVQVPDGEELASLELFWNNTRLAALYDGPFVQTVEIPATDGVGYLRAVATLKDSTLPPVEDVVMINTPAYMEELNVHLVELPTTVLIDGKPASHLTEKAFKVTDDGKPVSLAKFEYVKNLPLSLGIAIDMSGSMVPRMEEAQKAGAEFCEEIMRRGDKAFLVAFATQPQLVQKWSSRVGDMHAGLAKLRAEQMTALYDAIVYSLYHFQGIRGQKALIVISDGGHGRSSPTTRRSNTRGARWCRSMVGIGIRGTEMDVRSLAKLSQERRHGFYIEAAARLRRHSGELRSPVHPRLLPSPDEIGGKWRGDVLVTEGRRERSGVLPVMRVSVGAEG
jgi:hypothetical protein